MANTATDIPVKTETAPTEHRSVAEPFRPLETLRREVDRLFDSFDRGYGLSPFPGSTFDFERLLRNSPALAGDPAIDVTESEEAFDVRAELPGMDENDIEVKLANGSLVIKGEKQEDRKEGERDYYVRERRFGSFERRIAVPERVDPDKVDASFRKGILTVTLPKKEEARQPDKKIDIKSG